MKAYLMTVVWAAVAGILAELIGDDGQSGAKLLRLLTGIMILSAVISPLRSLLQIGPDSLLDRLRGAYEEAQAASAEAGEIYAEGTMELIRTMGETEAANTVTELVAGEFALPAECCRAEVDLTEENGQFSLSEVRIILSGKGVFADPYAVETYLEELLGCKAEVSLE